MIVGTAGHIDHGKTTLVRALTGVDTDRLPEERRRGITIELGFAPLRLDDGTVAGVVDVPGHEAFVRTMVAGAAGVDVALLVVAADEGVMPQTREHAAILGLLGVSRGVVALAKCDLVEDEWLALVRDDLRLFLADGPLADARVVETAAAAGRGIAELRTALSAAAAGLPRPGADDLFRMPVDRAFSVRGTGTVATGTAWSGRVAREAQVRAMPAGLALRVRGVQAHGEAVSESPPRGRTALALAGCEPADVGRGVTLVTGAGWAPTRALRADALLLPGVSAPGPRTRVRLHLGTAEVGARVVARWEAGRRVPARLVLDAPVVARAGDRFVLRGGPTGATIGGGVVADPLPPGRRPRAWPAADLPVERRLALVLQEAGRAGVALDALPVRLGLTPAAADRLVGAAAAVVASGRAFAAEVAAERAAALVAVVEVEHDRQPLAAGLSVQTARVRLDVPDALADRLLADLARDGRLELRGGVVCRAGWAPRLSAEQEALAGRLEAELRDAGEEPPTADELARRHGGGALDLLRLLERRGTLRLVGGERYYPAATLAGLLDRLEATMQPGRVYSPAELRQSLGLPRRLAVPLLEYADEAGVTVRRADGRVLAGAARNPKPNAGIHLA